MVTSKPLAALRDHELVNYGDSAPGSAAVDWHRAFRDIEARLREWTGQLACGATHETRSRPSHLIDPVEWEQFVSHDANHRDRQAVSSVFDPNKGQLMAVTQAESLRASYEPGEVDDGHQNDVVGGARLRRRRNT